MERADEMEWADKMERAGTMKGARQTVVGGARTGRLGMARTSGTSQEVVRRAACRGAGVEWVGAAGVGYSVEKWAAEEAAVAAERGGL